MNQATSAYFFAGGLDTNSPAFAMKPGAVLNGLNYEPLVEGYGRIEGYERLDGRPAPSAASFYAVQFTAGSIAISGGSVITGATSGASAIAVAGAELDSGAFANGDAAGTFAVVDLTGMFNAGESFLVGGVPAGIVQYAPSERYAPSIELRAAWLRAAQNIRRALIQKVPGAGPVRGVAIHDDEIFAWRDNADHSAGGMWKATPAGWQQVNLGRKLAFTLGIAEFSEGNIIVGASSGATATVARLVKNAGDWGSTASGYIILSGQVGSFTGGEAIKIAGATVATANGADVPMSLPAGGRYMAISHNFYSRPDSFSMYVANGVGSAFEYCGGVFCPIATGSGIDTPKFVAEIANHLVLLWEHGSMQFSTPGEPLLYDVVQGAGEVGFGTNITNVIQANDTAIAIFGERRIATFSGTDQDTFQLSELTEDAGAFPWTAQRIGKTIYVDNRGLRDLSASQAYGDFKAGTISSAFDRYMNNRIGSGLAPVSSIISKRKSHYRLFWPDGQGISVLMAKKNVEAIPFSTGDMRVFCTASGDISQQEYLLAGAEDGFVYRLDAGNTYDGDSFDYFVMTPFCHFGDISREYRYHKIIVEMIAPIYTKIGIRALFDYEDGEKEMTVGNPFILYGGGALWNAANWNEFIWSAAYNGLAECSIDGLGRNASFLFAGTTEEEQDPHVLQSYTIFRTPRRFKR